MPNPVNQYRKQFGSEIQCPEIPYLITIQVESYKQLLQQETPPDRRENIGIQNVFTSNFPVISQNGNLIVKFISYHIDPPLYSPVECKNMGHTYAGPMRITLELTVKEDDVEHVKQQDVYIGDVPFMTDNATFIVNGSERIIVSQLHRSPGLFFELSQVEVSKTYTARIIPTKGAWLDFEIDDRQQVYALINKKRVHATTMLMCLVDDEVDRSDKQKVLELFYNYFTFTKEDNNLWQIEMDNRTITHLKDKRLTFDIIDSDKESIFCYADNIIENHMLQHNKKIYVTGQTLTKMDLYSDVILKNKLLAESCESITQKLLDSLPNGSSINVVDTENKFGKPILNSLKFGKCASKNDALIKLYTVIRPNEQARLNLAKSIMDLTFFSEERYSLSKVGRVKLNQKLGTDTDSLILSKQDIFSIVEKLLLIANGYESVDDPDGLEYRRVRSVGELVQNQFQQAIGKFARAIQDRLSSVTKDTSILELINSRHFISSIREFFGTSELSQLADQTNLLSELSHKRRLSSFGRGGLDRTRASTEVRDLHGTHYGRVCIIETPEGSAVGLVNSFAIFAIIDEYGFLCTPYRPVRNRKISNEIVYLSASDEKNKTIAHYDTTIFEDEFTLKPGFIHSRRNNDHLLTDSANIDYIDISPKQILSISSSLIPFIENDDAARAVLGANMQRQALPLIGPSAPLVGTGMESVVVRDSGSCVKAKHNGVIEYVSAEKIIIRNHEVDAPIIHSYNLLKFQKSNDGTMIDQIPCVSVGDLVGKGDIIANGAAVDKGEIALGRNIRIAFHSWKGGNYEDAIIISSQMAKQFSSVGLTKFEISTREIKQGIEQFTRDIPNINEEFINQLDESGIVNIGTEVKSGDILVGRVTPKGETNMTPDERLLRAIFGDKSIDVKDTSLRVPPGMRGTVVDVRVFTRKGVDKSKRAIEIENDTIKSYLSEREMELKILKTSFVDSAKHAITNYHIRNSGSFDQNKLSNWSLEDYLNYNIDCDFYKKLVSHYNYQQKHIEDDFTFKCKRLVGGDILPVGVLETIQVFVATEYVIQPGDKLAGRHGNKGIVSKVMSAENMPYTKDGEIIDMLFTSTGISGRMNIGQVLEVHLGWAAVNLGKKIENFLEQIKTQQIYAKQLRDFLLLIYNSDREKEMLEAKSDDEIIEFAKHLTNGVPFASPVFEGPGRDRIKELLELAGCHPSGKEELYDGETGLPFPQRVAVGVMYMMQLHHLVEKKEHARSVGPYSIITQQPIGGKSQMGAQRFGEMEVWTLQAYGAAYTTRETLTVKSDYPIGRARIFELISQGYDIFDQKGIPESFCVLLYELRALCLNIDCLSFKDGQFIPQDLINIENFDALKISIASAAQIRAWSYGEVTKPETIHYRTSKPNPDGIFSTRIFGPIKDYQCLCGKHRGTKRKGIICSKCGTEVTTSRVRRYRMGHIELATPVAHVWFAKVLPSRIAIVLDMSISNLSKLLKFESYAVISQGLSPYSVGQVISEHEYLEAMGNYEEHGFECLTGAEALESLLKSLNLSYEIDKIRQDLTHANESNRVKLIRRLKVLEYFYKNGTKPESMVLRVLPVLPPDLRPLVSIEGGRFASSDLNDLYRRIINRNNRLARLLKYSTPNIIIRNEKRMLQEAVDGLFDNSRRSQPITNTSNKRPLKSLADAIKGKQGRFRQNLLGKRVDYSGRSVIIVGPHLKLHQCGLPKSMALELFKPFVLARLVLRGFAPTLRIAKTLIENKQAEVWDILSEVTKNHVVLLNRAPTLHRLGIQAFEPVLIEGRAIQLHPLTCKAFNADFDGDQMGVHVLLSIESQLEARALMMSTKCILNPSNGMPIATPSRDIVLGLYAMTCIEHGFGNEDLVVANLEEAEHALSQGIIRHTTPIKVLMDDKIVDTTCGRLQLYNIIPKHPELSFDLVNKPMTSKEIQYLAYMSFLNAGEEATALFLDDLMRLGFQHATLCGATFSYSDLPVPDEKEELIEATNKMINEYQKQYMDGLIREDERHNKVTSAWSKCADTITEKLMERLAEQKPGQIMNPIYMMAISGARGSTLQLRQLAAMRGLIAKSDGSVQESPIIHSFIEGMNVREYILAAQGARKGISDIALKTANSGYLTRRLADTAQDCITKIEDCGTINGIKLTSLTKSGNTIMKLGDRAFGRTLAEDLFDDDGKLIAKAGDIVDTKIAKLIEENELISIIVRSPVTCQYSGAGICCKCYGYDLSSLKPVNKHVAVGIIAAQSIGEPGTQLTMKNFQSGGAAQNILSDSRISSICNGVVKMTGIRTAEVDGINVVISRNNILEILDNRGRVVVSHRIPHGAHIMVHHEQKIQKGDVVAEWDPYILSLIAEKPGVIKFKDLAAEVSFNEVVDHNTGLMKLIVKPTTERFSPALILQCTDGSEITYPLLPNDSIEVENGTQVTAGQLLAQRTQNIVKSQDIIGGLPLIGDLFEARLPKSLCIMSEIDGSVEIVKGTHTKVIIRAYDGTKKEYTVPKNVNLIVANGDRVESGDFLTDGRPSMHDILQLKGPAVMSRYFTDEVQSVYQMQGITIGDKHIEIVLRQMLGSAVVLDPGDTALLREDVTRIEEIKKLNSILERQGKKQIQFRPVLNGISKAAISEKTSFFAAASFQETARRLITAAVRNEIDCLSGMKETLITGQLIPAGIGGIIREVQADMIKTLEDTVLEAAAKDQII